MPDSERAPWFAGLEWVAAVLLVGSATVAGLAIAFGIYLRWND